MKKLIFIISLSFCFVVLCVCTLLGIRIGPAIQRTIIVFVVTYALGFVAALIIFIAYFSGNKNNVYENISMIEPSSEGLNIKEISEEE